MIETQRCLLDEIHESDYENVKELYLNTEVRKYLGGPRKEETIREVLNDMLRPNENCWYWIVREKQTKEFMGIVSLDPHHIGNDIEVSYQLLPGWWGAGYATEAVQEIINYAFDELKLSRVIAVTQLANIPSRNLLKRLHMELEQTYQRFGAEQGVYSIEVKKVNEIE
ncbi:GNAT family N-acetyltransferase [Bacillus cereus]|uniref:GNAT family N-acetyltransferase n=1 Tax=Bacillus cereus TaxID=1396 RepID=UPI00356EA066